MVMEFPGASVLLDQPGTLDSMAGGMAGSGGTISNVTILATPVRLGKNASGESFALYRHGEGYVVVFGTTAKEAKAVITALIRANRQGSFTRSRLRTGRSALFGWDAHRAPGRAGAVCLSPDASLPPTVTG
jgi:hypothetical protein